MPSYIRPARRAAQIAAIRINELANSENAPSDSDESHTTPIATTTFDSGFDRARQNGYDDTVILVKYLLKECDTAKCPEDRSNIAIKVFDIINKNPKILIHEPKFRNSVITKMNDLDKSIDDKITNVTNAKYDVALKMLKTSMRIHIHNSAMRNKINQHLAEISNTLTDYNLWATQNSLKKSFKTLRVTLESIKSNPEYVLA